MALKEIVDKSEFKPRVHDSKCQYCDYQDRKWWKVDIHINSRHELRTWYKCDECSDHVTHLPNLLMEHMLESHKKNIKGWEVKQFAIQDPKESEELKKNLIDEVTKQSNRERIPVSLSEFKDGTDPFACRYCGDTFKNQASVDSHVNTRHEMSIWYRCEECDFTTVCVDGIKSHRSKKHKDDKSSINEYLITDELEIETLRKARNSKYLPIYKPVDVFKPRISSYCCQYCDYHNTSKTIINLHVNTHHEMKDWYKCSFCKISFLSGNALKIHLRDLHHQEVTEDTIGEMKINDPEQIAINRHNYLAVKNVDEVPDHYCETDENKGMKVEVPEDIKIEEQDPEINCNVQEKQIKDSFSIWEPKNDGTDVARTEIKLYCYMPISQSDFKRRVDPETCQYCGDQFISKEMADYHVNTRHEMVEWFKCKDCCFAILSWEGLKNHLSNCHGMIVQCLNVKDYVVESYEEIRNLKKGVVSKNFLGLPMKSKVVRENLLIISLKEKDIDVHPSIPLELKERVDPLTCQYCGNRFKDKIWTDNHVIAVHELIYKCRDCFLTTLSVDEIKNHLSVHHGMIVKYLNIKDYLVNDPSEFHKLRKSKMFNYDLKEPAEDNNKFFIPISPSDFKNRVSPLTCQYCGDKFKSKTSANSHVNTRHEMRNWYRCEECDYTTLTVEAMKRHKSKIHKDNALTSINKYLIKNESEIEELRKVNLSKNPPRYEPVDVFKPRISSYRCQYCDYCDTSKTIIDLHINSDHEMKDWYKCSFCKISFLSGKALKTHLHNLHQHEVNKDAINEMKITNPEEIARNRLYYLHNRMESPGIGVKIPENAIAGIDIENCDSKRFTEKMKDFFPIGEESKNNSGGAMTRIEINASALCYMPISQPEFKRREDPLTCQYCGEQFTTEEMTDFHVNTCHEMVKWFKCKDCCFAILSWDGLKNHLSNIHWMLVHYLNIEDYVVKNSEEVERLKNGVIFKNLQGSSVKWKVIRENHLIISLKGVTTSDVDPVPQSEFKERADPLSCQYCGNQFRNRAFTDNHVNNVHEMMRWYVCYDCDFTTLSTNEMEIHLSSNHDNKSINDYLITNPLEIESLRSLRMTESLQKIAPINSDHEMRHLHKCSLCKHFCLSADSMKNHLVEVHNREIVSDTINEKKINDPKDVSTKKSTCLRKKRVSTPTIEVTTKKLTIEVRTKKLKTDEPEDVSIKEEVEVEENDPAISDDYCA